MMPIMRTTLTLRDDIAEALKKQAFQSGKSFKDTVNEILLVGLTTTNMPRQAKSYSLKPVRMGSASANIDIDQALQIADTLENDEIIRKLQLRK